MLLQNKHNEKFTNEDDCWIDIKEEIGNCPEEKNEKIWQEHEKKTTEPKK
jgi:hypothetical protein